MNKVSIGGKDFIKYVSQEEINDIIKSIAKKINADYKDKEIFFIGILNGSFMFAGDLFKYIKGNHKISFIKVSSYEGLSSSSQLRELIGLEGDLEGKDIIIIEDIIDTGFSMDGIIKTILKKNPASVEICTLMFKPNSFKRDFRIKYVGKNISDEFIIGYGFDYDGYGRNHPHIYQLIEN